MPVQSFPFITIHIKKVVNFSEMPKKEDFRRFSGHFIPCLRELKEQSLFEIVRTILVPSGNSFTFGDEDKKVMV